MSVSALGTPGKTREIDHRIWLDIGSDSSVSALPRNSKKENTGLTVLVNPGVERLKNKNYLTLGGGLR